MKILVDTSVWVDHLRDHDEILTDLLLRELVICHPLIIGELAWGLMKRRDTVLRLLRGLPRALVAQDEEVVHFVNRYRISEGTIGYVGAHLLTAAVLTPDAVLWTRDADLSALTRSLEMDFEVA